MESMRILTGYSGLDQALPMNPLIVLACQRLWSMEDVEGTITNTDCLSLNTSLLDQFNNNYYRVYTTQHKL